MDQKNEVVHMNLAAAYASAGEYENARKSYESILLTNPKNYEAYLEIAKVCIALKDNEGAKKYLSTLKEKDSSYKTTEVTDLLASL